MNTNLTMIKKLREETGAGVQDCRKALELAEYVYANALCALHEKAAEDAAKRANRPASQGMIELYSHGGGRIGVMVEVSTETDFASRSPVFRTFAHEVALQIAAAAPEFIRDEDIPAQILAEESLKAAARAQNDAKPAAAQAPIIEGCLAKYKTEHVLLRQAYIRDDKMTVADLLNQAAAVVGENIVIRRFARWEMNASSAQE
jgi:elongation factor Ts